MLFDAPVNVYSDSKVILSDLTIKKPISAKERKKRERDAKKQKELQKIQRQMEKGREKISNMQDAAEGLR